MNTKLLKAMQDALVDKLFFLRVKTLGYCCLLVEFLVCCETSKLQVFELLLDLRKYQLDRVELGHVGHVPNVLNVMLCVHCFHILMKVHSEVVK